MNTTLLRLAFGVAATVAGLSAQSKLISGAQIAQAEAARKQYPTWAPAAAALGSAYVLAARETGDPVFLEKAAEQVAQSLKLGPNDPAALKVRARILLERRDLPAAQKLLESLRQRGPDDLEVSSLLCTAYMNLGRYDQAEQAAQFIRDLRPAELMGYLRGAEFRELIGDLGGALTYYRESFVRTPTDLPQEKARILVQMAHVLAISGNQQGADQALRQADQLAPGFYGTALERGRALLAKGDAQAARTALEQAQPTPSLEWRYWHTLALQRSGKTPDWKPLLQEARSFAPELLARYYLEVGHEPEKALTLLQERAKTWRDVQTLHLLAWAQMEVKEYDRASETLAEALRVGVKEPEMLYHATQIAQARGDVKAAAQYKRELAALNANSPFVAELR